MHCMRGFSPALFGICTRILDALHACSMQCLPLLFMWRGNITVCAQARHGQLNAMGWFGNVGIATPANPADMQPGSDSLITSMFLHPPPSPRPGPPAIPPGLRLPHLCLVPSQPLSPSTPHCEAFALNQFLLMQIFTQLCCFSQLLPSHTQCFSADATLNQWFAASCCPFNTQLVVASAAAFPPCPVFDAACAAYIYFLIRHSYFITCF